MRCYACDSTDHEVFAPGTLHGTSEMRVCKGCGNVMHTVVSTPEADARMKEYYRREYRPAPTVMNILTTTNKLGYVRMTLDALTDKMATERDRPLITGDIGCATGYLVNYLRRRGHRATGCELTIAYRRFCETFYGIPITEELTPKHKYDLLTMYHVLEHLPEPDKRLAEYVKLMADDGRFFLSVPQWGDVLEEASGSEMASFDHLYHKDHINVFSKQSLQNLFARAGLVIESEDHEQYGQTYVLRKKTPSELVGHDGAAIGGESVIVKEDWQAVVAKLKAAKAAIEAYVKRDYKAAIAIWPKFPEAHLKLIMEVNGKEPAVQRELFMEIKPSLGDNHRILRALGVWLYQNQQYEDSLQVFEQVMRVRPGADVHVWMAWCYREMGPAFYKKASAAFFKAADADPRKWAEMYNNICALAVKLPAWDEVAAERTKEALFAQSGRVPSLLDPVMDPEAAEEARKRREPPAPTV